MAGTDLFLVFMGFLLVFAFGFILLVTRYKRCASDEILVVYGRVKGGRASVCIHGGARMVWPLIQDYKKLSLVPMTINIPLTDARSQDKIKTNVSSTFTIGISTHWPVYTEYIIALGTMSFHHKTTTAHPP